MIIGVPKEIKEAESRVAIIPAGVQALRAHGHRVLVQRGAGVGSGLTDDAYAKAGAELIGDPTTIYAQADLIYKVKEPLPAECEMLREGQVLFTFLHLAPTPELTKRLLARRVVAVAYETVETPESRKLLLEPMSEIAGRMAIHVGAHYLATPYGGRGVLIGGVPGVPPATVVILGGGTVGANAAKVAAGMGAWVYLLDVDQTRMRHLDEVLPENVTTLISNSISIEECVRRADIVIGAVYVSGARAPKLVTREMVTLMNPGSVIVDVAIDQGGCIETSHSTSHSDPVYVVDGILHYCVANMPGAFARTSTFALTNVTLPYALRLADSGWRRAIRECPELALGLNIALGQVTHPAVAEAHGLGCLSPLEAAKG
jgi:alanine dehydrogenase